MTQREKKMREAIGKSLVVLRTGNARGALVLLERARDVDDHLIEVEEKEAEEG